VQLIHISALQHTVLAPVSCEGVGVHSGALARLTIKPAAADSGIVFVRTDVAEFARRVPAHAERVTTTKLGTTIANSAGVSVATVEHVLAALFGMGVDNAVVEIDGPEVPILDGSSEPFVEMIEIAGLRSQGVPRRTIEVLKPIQIGSDDRFARLEPHDGFELDVTVDFESRAIGCQRVVFACTPEAFADELGSARTFGFLHQVEALRAMGLAQGGSMDNAVVIDGDAILNDGGLRFDDEFARHKALDAVGDLALAGAPLRGRYVASQSGHEMNVALVRALLADTNAWRWSFAPVTTAMLPAAGA
jgi:UDP-3-O-[3-hydroxymyristoyl] N-acetylglucosamine deacetylase